MNLHGTRSVQKVIEVCRGSPSQVALVVDALRDATVTLCLDTNGNHVVQRLLQHLAPADNAFVYEVSGHRGGRFLLRVKLGYGKDRSVPIISHTFRDKGDGRLQVYLSYDTFSENMTIHRIKY